jgi:4-hydroxy 2-oxovalerate aldolase
MKNVILDCTLRDGGYYNNWDFPMNLVQDYLIAMEDSKIDIVEIGFRSLLNNGFKGPYAYSTDGFLNNIAIPEKLKICVMVNGTELIKDGEYSKTRLDLLFPNTSLNSKVDVVRIACHYKDFKEALKSVNPLVNKGYSVGFNIMQIAQCNDDEIISVGLDASKYNIDVLYFADSFGGMTPSSVESIINLLRLNWKGQMGIHTHDNMGLALQNTMKANSMGVTWLDSTVTGMGRGPGNAKTEELIMELFNKNENLSKTASLLKLLKNHFIPLQKSYEWGKNPYYFLSGKFGIHPSYIQKMLSDSRYDETDILAVIDHLKGDGIRKYNEEKLNNILNFYDKPSNGTWHPESIIKDREVLILGTGPGVKNHRIGIQDYIKSKKPIVFALNTQCSIDSDLIDYRIACHPVRLLADCKIHATLNQPLITPLTMLPSKVKEEFEDKNILDYGIEIQHNNFKFNMNSCVIPNHLVMSYAFGIAGSGKASKILLAGYDGYKDEDPRNDELNSIIKLFVNTINSPKIIAVTPTRYDLLCQSIYSLIQ